MSWQLCVARAAFAVALVTFATFTDIVAYSIAIPVLPELSRRLGASPTMIGLLFGSFGVTLLIVSMPMGAVSDRIGRKAPIVAGLLALAAATPAVRVRGHAALAVRGPAGAGRRRRRHLGRRLRADRGPLRQQRARPRHGHRHVGHQLRVHVRADARRLALRDSAASALPFIAVAVMAIDRRGVVRVAPDSTAPGACRSGARRHGAARAGDRRVRPRGRRRSPPPCRCSNRCCRST